MSMAEPFQRVRMFADVCRRWPVPRVFWLAPWAWQISAEVRVVFHTFLKPCTHIYWTWDDTVAEESSHGCIPGSADGASRAVIKHVSCPGPRILTASVSSSFSDGCWSKNAWSSSFLGSNITTLFQSSFLEMFPHPLDPLDPLRHRPVRYGQFYSQSSSQVGRHQLEW